MFVIRYAHHPSQMESRYCTLILFDASNPSSWLRSSNIVRCTSLSPLPLPDSILADPMLSISSMKMIEGACSLQRKNQEMIAVGTIKICIRLKRVTQLKIQSFPGLVYAIIFLGCLFEHFHGWKIEILDCPFPVNKILAPKGPFLIWVLVIEGS